MIRKVINSSPEAQIKTVFLLFGEPPRRQAFGLQPLAASIAFLMQKGATKAKAIVE